MASLVYCVELGADDEMCPPAGMEVLGGAPLEALASVLASEDFVRFGGFLGGDFGSVGARIAEALGVMGRAFEVVSLSHCSGEPRPGEPPMLSWGSDSAGGGEVRGIGGGDA